MIVKEPDILPLTKDPLANAGHDAEKQMAFYLRRAFADRSDLLVYNGLRFERSGDAAQIDHLILHRYGIFIIESKSVSSRVTINEHEEWTRWSSGRSVGMPSPVLQAKRQGQFLRQYLEVNGNGLLSGIGPSPARFGDMPVDILVAISDRGVVQRAPGLDLPEVSKADQVPDKVEAIFQRRRATDTLSSVYDIGIDRLPYMLSDDELNRVGAFLLTAHRPIFSSAAHAAPPAVAEGAVSYVTTSTPPDANVAASRKAVALMSSQADPVKICRHCSHRDLLVEYGKFGYYLKCRACYGNTPIHIVCPKCRGKERIRKDKLNFYAECPVCGSSRLYHVNIALNPQS